MCPPRNEFVPPRSRPGGPTDERYVDVIQRIEDGFRRLAAAQVRSPWWFVVAAWLLIAGSVPFLAKLELHSSWTSLLPTDKPSVVDLERVGRRVGGLTSLSIVVESQDLPAMQRFVTALVPRLERIGPPVRAVDWNMSVYSDFVRAHRELYASVEDLEDVRDSLQDRLTYERGRANPFFVQLDDEVPPDPRLVLERIETRASEAAGRRPPGGFYAHPDGTMLVVFIRADTSSGNAADLRRLTRDVEAAVRAVGPANYAADLRVSYAGSVIDTREEHAAIEAELSQATGLSVVLVLALLWGFFRSARSMPIIGFALMVPVLMTFAYAQIAIGHLNTSTAFLGSIVVGNGVNPYVVWLARYYEERRRGLSLAESLAETHLGAWQGTLAASVAAALAYGSMIVTDFRGFHDFGVIGLVGMLLCWLGSALLLPAAVVVVERLRPLTAEAFASSKPWFGPLVTRLVFGSPGALLAGGLVLALASVGVSALAIAKGPFELDFRKLRSESASATTSQTLGRRIKEIIGPGNSESNVYIVLDRREDVAPLRARLEDLRDHHRAPWGNVRTLDDLLPKDQEAKILVLGEIREILEQYRRYADADLARTIDRYEPAEEIAPLTLQDLPTETARLYSERDGTRGRIVVVSGKRGRSVWDGSYLVEWAKALRTVRLPDGSRPPLAGTAPVFADMIESILEDGPKAALAALGVTILLLAFTFRSWRDQALTLGALLLGLLWMAGVMAAAGMKLNFLNFVAFPISCGVGADYGVNVMKRYVLDRAKGADEAIRAAIEDSGGAVILCSLTTIVGYSTLLISSNPALRSFGFAMSVSEVTCLAAALLVLPAALVVAMRRRPDPSVVNSQQS